MTAVTCRGTRLRVQGLGFSMVTVNALRQPQKVTLRAGDGQPVATVALGADNSVGVYVLDQTGKVAGKLSFTDAGAVFMIRSRGRDVLLVRIELAKLTVAAFD